MLKRVIHTFFWPLLKKASSWKTALFAGVMGIGVFAFSAQVPRDTEAAGKPPRARSECLRPEILSTPRAHPIRGTAFPEGVLALTWDDGPDADTVELAKYLKKAKVSATFFVVGEWIDGVSEEPGVGQGIFSSTGYRRLPAVLADLTALGHRLGGHTENHVLLTEASFTTAREQIASSMRAIDDSFNAKQPRQPKQQRLKMFRAPGGAWSRDVAQALVEVESSDATLVGPIGWDIDAKDWDGSLHCRSAPKEECEPSAIAGETRVRADVMARRYLAQIEAPGARRGIVLLHDRVGDVGSHYALDVARHLIPELTSRGYVFAAPVLRFSALMPHDATSTTPAPAAPKTEALLNKLERSNNTKVAFGDLNGDGRADKCMRSGDVGSGGGGGGAEAGWRVGDVHCALADGRGDYKASTLWSTVGDVADFCLVDINGDGRDDLCVLREDTIGDPLSAHHIECAAAP